MPNYSYKAKNLKGEEETGFLEAKSHSHLAKILRQKGYFLLSAEEEGKKKKKKFKIQALNIFAKLVGVSTKEKLFFTRNLELMIETGVPLPKAFNILAEQAKSKKFKQALKDISGRIIKGESLSQALGNFPKIFPKIYQETLKVGEETGKLGESLHVLAKQIERDYNLKSQIKTAMAYPLIVLMMAVLIGIVMFIFAVPKLSKAFEELEIELPFTTQLMFSFADFITEKWPIALLSGFVLIFLLFTVLRSKRGEKFKSKFVLVIPLISKISRNINSVLTLRTLSSLLASGVPIVQSLEVASGSLSNFYFKKALKEASEKVEKGSKLSQALKEYEELYSPLVLEMMKIGEETGETSRVLESLANFYEKELNSTLQKLSSIIEPFLIMLIGGVVGFFAVSMMQPMFSIMGGM